MEPARQAAPRAAVGDQVHVTQPFPRHSGNGALHPADGAGTADAVTSGLKTEIRYRM